MADELNTATAAIDRSSGVFMLPTAILQQDAVVIDEQENHVVLTLRIPIDLIRENLTTLMALSEIATRQAEPEKGDLDDPD